MTKRHGIRKLPKNGLVIFFTSAVCGFLLGTWTRICLVPCPTPLTDGKQGRIHIFDQTVRSGHHLSSKSDSGASSNNQLSDQQVQADKKVVVTSSDGRDLGKKQLVLIGVMTARKYVRTRVVAAYHTWASQIPGQVVFFTSGGSEKYAPPGIPVIGLPGVDDSYPPVKKSFMMLKYMHDNHLNDFEYFMRADDDVYIRGHKLEEFLRSINSSRALFIGQAGQGNKEEVGLLNLHGDENFCMGGPSMLFSGETLAKVGPNVGSCLQNLYSTHEDVEIGRCVNRFANVRCTWAFEVRGRLDWVHLRVL